MNNEISVLLESANASALATNKRRNEDRVEAQGEKRMKVDNPVLKYVVKIKLNIRDNLFKSEYI